MPEDTQTLNSQDPAVMQQQIDDLTRMVRDLTDAFYANNFPASQDFNKYVRFNARLKVPHYDTLPTKCDVGELAESGGKLRVCSAVDTWTIVGTQS